MCTLKKEVLEALIVRRELDGEPIPAEDNDIDLAKTAPLHAAIAEAKDTGTCLATERIPALVSLGCGVNQTDHLGYTPSTLPLASYAASATCPAPS